jgi:hypothetical protein
MSVIGDKHDQTSPIPTGGATFTYFKARAAPVL